MNAAMKVIGAVITFFGIILIVFSYKDVIPFFTDSPAERFESLWMRDLTTLIGNKSLPDGFFNAKEIKYNAVSPTVKDWLKTIRSPLKTKPEGTHRIDVFMDDWADGDDYGVLIQYQLVDLKSGDTTWELGRTLILGKKTATTTTLAEQTASPSN